MAKCSLPKLCKCVMLFGAENANVFRFLLLLLLLVLPLLRGGYVEQRAGRNQQGVGHSGFIASICCQEMAFFHGHILRVGH